jgi:hypothetical protein
VVGQTRPKAATARRSGIPIEGDASLAAARLAPLGKHSLSFRGDQKRLADAAEAYGDLEVRLTTGSTVLLP